MPLASLLAREHVRRAGLEWADLSTQAQAAAVIAARNDLSAVLSVMHAAGFVMVPRALPHDRAITAALEVPMEVGGEAMVLSPDAVRTLWAAAIAAIEAPPKDSQP